MKVLCILMPPKITNVNTLYLIGAAAHLKYPRNNVYFTLKSIFTFTPNYSQLATLNISENHNTE